MAKQRENMLEAFKASHDQTVRNQRAAEAVEASRRIRGKGLLASDAEALSEAPIVPVELPPVECDVIAPRSADPLPSQAAESPASTTPGKTPGKTPGGSRAGSAGTAKADLRHGRQARSWGWSRKRSAPDDDSAPQLATETAGLDASPEFAQPDHEVELVSLPMGWLAFFALQAGLLLAAFGLGWMAASGSASDPALEPTEVAAAEGLDLVLGTPPGRNTRPSRAGEGSPLRAGRSLEGLGEADPAALDRVVTAGQPREADLAFDDPVNRFTVQASQYTDNDFGRERAWAAFQFLDDLGLPVVSPRVRDGWVYLFVGAEGQVAGLKAVLDEVRKVRDRKGREYPFHDAYVENISGFL